MFVDVFRDSFYQGFFPRAIPTHISSWGRIDPVFKPATLDRSSASTFSSSDRWHRPDPYEEYARRPIESFGKFDVDAQY